MLDDAFQSTRWHSLLANLRDVTPEDWLWVPPQGKRSIRDIVRHIGHCKFMWYSQSFGDGSFTWDGVHKTSLDRAATVAGAVDWLRQGHALLHESIAALTDADLDRPRQTLWGEERDTRHIITLLIEHDIYHAGEINHIRSLHQGNDDWGNEPDDSAPHRL
jgi:uncharacterized damage-inducible protein DinB